MIKSFIAGIGCVVLAVLFAPLPTYASDTLIQDLEIAAQKHSDDSGAFLRLGNAYLNANRDNEALNAFETARSLDPGSEIPHYNIGVTHLLNRDFRRAASAFQKAIKLAPAFAEAKYNLGASYEGLNQHTNAVNAYKEAFELNIELSDIKNNPALANSSLTYLASMKLYQETSGSAALPVMAPAVKPAPLPETREPSVQSASPGPTPKKMNRQSRRNLRRQENDIKRAERKLAKDAKKAESTSARSDKKELRDEARAAHKAEREVRKNAREAEKNARREAKKKEKSLRESETTPIEPELTEDDSPPSENTDNGENEQDGEESESGGLLNV